MRLSRCPFLIEYRKFSTLQRNWFSKHTEVSRCASLSRSSLVSDPSQNTSPAVTDLSHRLSHALCWFPIQARMLHQLSHTYHIVSDSSPAFLTFSLCTPLPCSFASITLRLKPFARSLTLLRTDGILSFSTSATFSPHSALPHLQNCLEDSPLQTIILQLISMGSVDCFVVDCRTGDEKVSGSFPGRSGWRIFVFHGRLSVLTLISVSVSSPCYRSYSSTHMQHNVWLRVKRHCKLVHGCIVYTEHICAETPAVSHTIGPAMYQLDSV